MVEPLRKRHANGSLYRRRAKVEEELEELEKLGLPEILARARAGEQAGKTTVSSEALVYFLRRAARSGGSHGPGVDGLVSILMERAERTVQRHISGAFDELQREEICREVIDGVVDDITDTGDRGDYAEVNFNDCLAHNRDDACRKQLRRVKRTERLGEEVDDLGEDDEQPVPHERRRKDPASAEPKPEAAYALDEAREKARLPHRIEAGEFSPEDQYRIAEAVRQAKLQPNVLDAFLLHNYWDMPIDSKEPDKHTLVKHFGKSEKTIRLWLRRAEEAFDKLRGER
jgi:hypothetical protein